MLRRAALAMAVVSASCTGTSEDDAASADQASTSCTTPLFDRVEARVRRIAHAGTVPKELVSTRRNRIDPSVQIDAPAIFGAMKDAIAGAKRDVRVQFYGWDVGSALEQKMLDAFRDLARARAAAASAEPVVVRILVDAGSTF